MQSKGIYWRELYVCEGRGWRIQLKEEIIHLLQILILTPAKLKMLKRIHSLLKCHFQIHLG